MNPPSPNSPENTIRATAARWLIRRDRGLSSAESIEYELWLAADERHAAAMQHSAAAWSLLDRLPESAATPVLAAATRRRSFWRRTFAVGSLAAAAALALGLFVWFSPAPDNTAPTTFAADSGPRTVALSDGSLVQLNTGSEVVEQFSPGERHVLLARGEAHFSVTKNPARPFTVRAGALQIRAVGTAFNINLQATTVDVVVTEGRVQLASGTPSPSPTGPGDHPGSPSAPPPPPAPPPALDVGERAILHSTPVPPPDLAQALTISRLDAAEMTRTLSWREPLLRLGGATLAELAIEFERATGRHLVLADPALAELRFGGRFRSDDIEGFTHLLATTLDLDVERAADGTIVLRKKNSNSP